MPRIYARTVNMPLLLIIVATIAGGTLDGMVGILIGIPVAGTLKVVFDYVVAERLRGRAAAEATMVHEPTDAIEREVTGEADQEPVAVLEPEIGPDGAIVRSYSPFEPLPEELSSTAAGGRRSAASLWRTFSEVTASTTTAALCTQTGRSHGTVIVSAC